LNLRYSNKIGEGSAAGKAYNGKIIDSDDYTEEVYDANQFHGQDGLGRFVFGHSDNQQARLEAGNANGEVRGNYCYFLKLWLVDWMLCMLIFPLYRTISIHRSMGK
jgi:hypothetical protein